jgi:hypothetical protein
MKFRVWDTKRKVFLDCTQWALSGNDELLKWHSEYGDEYWREAKYDYNVEGFVIQYGTGMKDWTGREIHEGDLIKVKDYGPYPVTFEDGCFGSCIYSDFEPLRSYKVIEVVGNILENPDWNEDTD